METTLFQITFEDGREYRVFCANKAQKQKVLARVQALKEGPYPNIKVTDNLNGIHTANQWEGITNNILFHHYHKKS